MTVLQILRQLADEQRHEVLRANAQAHLEDTGELAAWPLLALAHAHAGDRPAAIAALARARQVQDELDLHARADLAAACLAVGDRQEAEDLLQAVLREDPGHAPALLRMAACHAQAHRWAQASADCRRCIAVAPAQPAPRLALVRSLLMDGRADEAQQALDTAGDALDAAQDGLAPEPVPATSAPTGVHPFMLQMHALQLELWAAGGHTAQAEAWLTGQRQALPQDAWVTLVTGYATVLAGRDRHAEADLVLRDALEHCPEHLALVQKRAELAQELGRTLQAVQILRRALALDKREGKPAIRQVRLLLALAGAAHHRFPAQAQQAARQALDLVEALQPDDTLGTGQIRRWRLQAMTALARAHSEAQAFDTAQQLFEQVLQEDPSALPALQGLAHQQMQRGRIDEAVELFERVSEIDPMRGTLGLINARRVPDDPQILERLESMARLPSLEGSARASVLFHLAAAREKRGEFDRAIALAHDANAAARRHLRYDPAVHRQACARVRHAFCKALYEHRKDCGYRGEDESLPVFVLGMPRSGTTLVEQILAGHSQIFGAGELGVIPSRIQGLSRWERHVGSGRDYPDCIDDLDAHTTRGIAQGILKELRELAAPSKPEARHVVDKLPHNFENVGLIKYLFPKARIVSVRRDPRDIAMSNYFTDYAAKHGGMGFAYDLGWIGRQLADHHLLMHHWRELFPGDILEVNYEDVVEDTEGQARRMLDYIGVPWETQVLQFNELDRPVKTASVWQVRQPIYRTSKAKWMRYRDHLAPLIEGTNAKITWEPIEMATMPVAGMFTAAVALYRQDNLAAAEHGFRKVLHHLPEHAGAGFMLGLILARGGHLAQAVEWMDKAVSRCPWHAHWWDDLIQAQELAGLQAQAQASRERRDRLTQRRHGPTEATRDGAGAAEVAGTTLALADDPGWYSDAA